MPIREPVPADDAPRESTTHRMHEQDKKRPAVLGVTAGVIGSLEANLAIAHLLGLPDPLNGELFYYFGKQMSTSRIRVERSPDCPVCGSLFSSEGR